MFNLYIKLSPILTMSRYLAASNVKFQIHYMIPTATRRQAKSRTPRATPRFPSLFRRVYLRR
jgi:hypothetical protein